MVETPRAPIDSVAKDVKVTWDELCELLSLKVRLAQEEIRRFDSSEAIFKFEDLENRIERMEAEADLVNFGKKPAVEAEWESLLVDDEIEKELQTLKSSSKKENEGTSTV